MKNLHKRRLRAVFPYPELMFNLVVAVMAILQSKILLFTILIIVCLCIHSLFLLHRSESMKVYYRKRKAEQLAENRLKLIRKITDMAYTYSCDTDQFYNKVCELMQVNKLTQMGIVEFPGLVRSLSKHITISELAKADIDFYCLMKTGFTARELTIVYNHKNPTSIYVKKRRLVMRLEKHGIKNPEKNIHFAEKPEIEISTRLSDVRL